MAKVPKTFKYYARTGANRVVNGLMHIIVRNDMAKDDAIEEYYRHWGGANDPDANAKDSHPFNNSQTGNPSRENHLKAIGDYDSFLYFVTVAANLQAHETNGSVLGGSHTGSSGSAVLIDAAAGWVARGIEGQIVKNTTDGSQGIVTASTSTQATIGAGMSGGTDNDFDNGDAYQICNNPEAQPWFTSPPSHTKCQSFVRHQLLGRHNNVDGHDSNNYLQYGLPVKEFGCSAAGNGVETILVEQNKVGSDSRLVVNQGLFSDQNFGSELSGLNSNNTFFSPVSLIEIYGYHPFGTDNYDTSSSGQFKTSTTHYALLSHDTTFYNLIVDIDLHGYENPASSGLYTTFFRNKVNIFFQPFGETAEVQFSQTPGVAFTS
jgi:hypothetical protein